MIVTVTMNPALDKTAEVEKLLPGELNRLENVRIDPGGKGINVSKMINVLKGKSICTGFVGGDSGTELCRLIDKIGLSNDFLVVDGLTRTNLKVIDADRKLTELNEPGIKVTEQEVDLLFEKVVSLAGENGVVMLGGSLPKGASSDTYYHFVKRLKEVGCIVILDADGEAFRHGLKALPNVIKPNRFELLQYYSLPEDTPDDKLPELCGLLLEKGIELIALSMGEKGAMFFTSEKSVRVKALQVEVGSTVGAGDSMVGAIAFAIFNKLSFEETIRLAMATSIGAVTTQGTNPPDLEIVTKLKDKIEIVYI